MDAWYQLSSLSAINHPEIFGNFLSIKTFVTISNVVFITIKVIFYNILTPHLFEL